MVYERNRQQMKSFRYFVNKVVSHYYASFGWLSGDEKRVIMFALRLTSQSGLPRRMVIRVFDWSGYIRNACWKPRTRTLLLRVGLASTVRGSTSGIDIDRTWKHTFLGNLMFWHGCGPAKIYLDSICAASPLLIILYCVYIVSARGYLARLQFTPSTFPSFGYTEVLYSNRVENWIKLLGDIG